MPQTKKTPPKFQSRTVVYPQHAFLVYMSLSNRETKTLYPFEFIYPSIDALKTEAESFRNYFAKENIAVDNECVVIPIDYLRDVPLKPEYWTQTDYVSYYHTPERQRRFSRLLSAPAFFTVLVTPHGRRYHREYLAAAIPLPTQASETAIRQFMMGSDFPVDRQAKNAALYRPQKPFALDWKRKIVLPVHKFTLAEITVH